MKCHPVPYKLLRDYGKAKTHAGKSGILGKAAKLDGTGSCTLTLVNGMRNIFLCNVSFIGCIVNDHTAVFVCVVHPFLQLVLCNGRAGGVIWEAQINQIRHFFRKFRQKTVFLTARHIDHAVKIFSCSIVLSGTSCHDIGIHINRVNRVTDSHLVVNPENLLDISGIAFRTVGNKDFVCCNVTSPVLIVIFCNGISQKFIPQIRSIAAEGFRMCHLIHRTVKGIDDCRNQRLCHIPDSKADDFLFRVLLTICLYFFRNRGKQIAPR